MNSPLVHPSFFRAVANRSLMIPNCYPRMLVMLLAWAAMFAIGCQGESARWEFAQAQLLLEQDQPDAALKQMRNAVEKSGDAWELALPFALELAKRQERESVTICDRMLNQEQVQANEPMLKNVLETKRECQSRLGDFAGALSTLKIILRERIERDKLSENNLAYFRALANQELELAVLNINNAIHSIHSDWCCGERLALEDRTIVASALLARYFLDETRRDPSIESIEVAEARVQRSQVFLDGSIQRIESRFGKRISCEMGDQSTVNLERCTARSNLAVLFTVRALILQDLGLDANSDLLSAKENSKDFEKVLKHLPSDGDCLHLLQTASPFLDTRGFIKSKIQTPEFYQSALEDLDIAIFACHVERRAIKGQLFNNVNFSVRKALDWERMLNRSEAVLRHHRLMTYEQGNDLQAAQADQIEIEKLGFTIDHQLH